jgi:hypothetical protein
MPCEFLDKPEAENRPLGGVMKDVETDQTGVKVLVSSVVFRLTNFVLHFVIENRYTEMQFFCQGLMARYRIV